MRFTTPSTPPERIEHGIRWATLPNLLSVVRALFLVPILVLLDRPGEASDAWVVVLLLVAGLSDFLDGYLARHRDAVSPTGKVVDPLADKVLILGLLAYLVLDRGFPIWLIGLVVVRDLALIVGGLLLFRRDRMVFGANASGKMATFFLALTILAYVLEVRAAYAPLILMAAVMVTASFVSYGWRAWRYSRTM